jgi:hypothetical protein
MRTSHSYLATMVAVGLAILVLAFSRISEGDFLDEVVQFVMNVNALDEAAAAVGLVMIGLTIDLARRAAAARHLTAVQAERLHVFRATMRTVHQIVNTFLQSCQMVRLEAVGTVPADTLSQFDALIQDVAEHLRALGDLVELSEVKTAEGTSIAYPAPSRRPRERSS